MANFRSMEKDALYMRRAMELAGLGLGSVSPNPLVGAVVVCDDRIIGEGWHKKFGGPHAEVNALHAVADSSLLPSATVYVNLEPCAHTGKTPPCADLLVENNVKRVVISNRDPNPKVGGRGVEKLRAAGIQVTEGVLQKEGRWLNRRFFALMEEGIPYVILKWAETTDGKIAAVGPVPSWISNIYSRQRVHQWRTQEDAVLVGSRTAEIDNPLLTVREWTGRNPVRVVLDPTLRLPDTLHLFDGTQPTLRYNQVKNAPGQHAIDVKIESNELLPEVLSDLAKRNIGSVIVEGGRETLCGFIGGGWWHEARIFTAPHELGDGMPAPEIHGEVIAEDTISGDRLTVQINPARFRNG